MRLLTSVFALAFQFSVAISANAQEMTEDEFRAYVDGVADRLLSVWEYDVIPGIEMNEAYRGGASDLELRWGRACRLLPEYDRLSDPPAIVFDREAMLAILPFLEQALLLYLLDVGNPESPEEVDLYVTERLRPFLIRRQEECIDDDQSKLDLREVFLQNYFNLSTSNLTEYHELMNGAKNKPGAELLANYVSGFSKFLPVLHEAGHHLFHQSLPGSTVDKELEADEFALNVFRKNEIPVTFGLPFFQLMTTELRQREVECRILLLAKSDTNIVVQLIDIPTEYVRRLELLRQYYIEEYYSSC